MVERLAMKLCILLVLPIFALAPADGVQAAAVQAEQLIETALDLDANRRNGADIYSAQCVACHGVAGYGDATRSIPAVAGQRRAYLIMQFANFSEHDRASPQMHKVIADVKVREPQAWADLAAFLSAQVPMAAGEKGDGAGVNLGEASYVQWCSSCHEEDARGDVDGLVPSLRNQHYSYLVKAIRGIAAGHRANADIELVRFLGSLDANESNAIADYLSRRRGPVRDRAVLLDNGSISE